MNRDQAKTLLNQQPNLVRLVHEFNLWPTRYIHPTWIPRFIPENLFSQLRTNRRGEKRLAEILLAKLDLHRELVMDFDALPRRLALLSAQELQTLRFLCGVALSAHHITAHIRAQEVLSLREKLGARAHAFATGKARFLLGTAATLFDDSHAIDSVQSCVSERGATALVEGIGDQPEPVMRRLQLKFAKNDDPGWDRPLNRERGSLFFGLLKRILVQEVNPQWAPLFS